MTQITKRQVVSGLRQIARDYPDRINPKVSDKYAKHGERCVYTKGKRHCIVGQFAVMVGLPMPKPRAGSVCCLAETCVYHGVNEQGGLWAGLITPAAADLLNRAQREADKADPDLRLSSWSSAVERVLDA